ncbi:hypothetical protein J2752_002948 [Halarchaeum rubridurum]|uniref:Geranylgeranyl diphosphate synthase, type I n=1 Tax=Halarchaeum rubridurum TaxID=489911 RepID=A0A830G6B8_9EURY|nr:polyprenyl synthetase [Halarchaeum rubridurum]MBP1956017.1 hypothetical protein [Halarchaeum rubridurum]GGM77101.1 hypothetical protein GCM10009017_28520 [Halarchaeum rubridurum]
MTDTTGDIERELERVLPEAGTEHQPDIGEPFAADYWYGELSLHVHDTLADTHHDGAATAAAGVECLRAYIRLRGQLLVQLHDDVAHSFTADPTHTLLASDQLYAAAYAALARSGGPVSLFDAVTCTSQCITGALSTHYTDPETASSPESLVDDTMGALGEAAATIGAILADVTDDQHESVRLLGRGLGALEFIRRTDDLEPQDRHVVFPNIDEPRLDTYADNRRVDVLDALDDLDDTVDVYDLRALVPE